MIQRLLPFLTLIVLFVGLSIASPHFLTSTNLSSVVRQTAVINIMALGMTLVIITSGIDLSVGAILAMGGIAGTTALEHGAPILAGVLAGVAYFLILSHFRYNPLCQSHARGRRRPRKSGSSPSRTSWWAAP